MSEEERPTHGKDDDEEDFEGQIVDYEKDRWREEYNARILNWLLVIAVWRQAKRKKEKVIFT